MKDLTVEKEVLVERLKAVQGENANLDVEKVQCGEWAIELDKSIKIAERYQLLQEEGKLYTYKKGLLGKITLFVKRIFRRIVNWYLYPVCEKQTFYNRHTTAAMKYLRNTIAVMEKENQDLKEELNENKKHILALEEALQALENEMYSGKGE